MVYMKVRSLAPQADQDAEAEIYDHYTDYKFEHCFGTRRYCLAEQQQGATNSQQRNRVSESPDAAPENECATRALLLAQRGDSSQVVGLERVLHADQAAEHQ